MFQDAYNKGSNISNNENFMCNQCCQLEAIVMNIMFLVRVTIPENSQKHNNSVWELHKLLTNIIIISFL